MTSIAYRCPGCGETHRDNAETAASITVRRCYCRADILPTLRRVANLHRARARKAQRRAIQYCNGWSRYHPLQRVRPRWLIAPF